ncbi:unnamed protein product [Owenia fusiformis]|uniref:Guanine nucleotide exchange factor DBS n=1 Tax=Owenia fusiformis TaxID=6347 RepID=A0A8S4NK40_OWEFU|nr:unnamed protein product [Owenia fusiformis]
MADLTTSMLGNNLKEKSKCLWTIECLEIVAKMGESSDGAQITVVDVADILQDGYVLITGGKTRGGHTILSFPDNPSKPELSEEQYKRSITYLTTVPALPDVELGFVIVIDRRQSGSSSVKNLLTKIAAFFPALIEVVFVLRPTGFFARTFSGWGWVKEEFKFKVVLCTAVEELYDHIEPSQLTDNFSGSLKFDLSEWIEHRAAIEKFQANTYHVSKTVTDMVQFFQDAELPNDKDETEGLIQEHEKEKKSLIEDLSTAKNHGQVLLKCIVKEHEAQTEDQSAGAEPGSDKMVHIRAVERLVLQLEEVDKTFTNFWTNHERRLQQCLQLRRFEEEFKQLQYICDQHLTTIESIMESGDSLQRVEHLMKELRHFEEDSVDDFDKSEQLKNIGERLIAGDHYAVDSIKPKCFELNHMNKKYREITEHKREVLKKSLELQDRLAKASRWCSEGVDLLATQQIERCQTQDGALLALKDVETFQDKAKELNLGDPKEFKAMFGKVMDSETTETVQTILKRIQDVHDMCDKRNKSLKKLANTLPRPVQPVIPAPAEPLPVRKDAVGPTQRPDIESTRPIPKISPREIKEQPNKKAPPIEVTLKRKERKSKKKVEKSKSLPTDKPPKTRRPGMASIRQRIISQDSDTQDSESELVNQVTLDPEVLFAKRGHVMKELIDSERVYISEIESIIDGYAHKMTDPSMRQIIPDELYGKKHILFGNLEQIFKFHHEKFWEELEGCVNTPALVGKCFVNRKEEFQMYSEYCQNKPRSELLRREAGDNNPFFKECQKQLGHKLPLGAYLLKPVQRITKYQLLLKEMLKYTIDKAQCHDLQEALDTMLGVLKYVNDIMHQVAITGFPGRLADQGRLWMQDSFNVWLTHAQKKDRLKDIRFKPMQRHIFLYENSILFSKKMEDKYKDKEYIYKSSLKTSQIGLTENVKGDKKKFEIWLHNKQQTYIIQAPSIAVKQKWVEEVKAVLQRQFDRMKEAIAKKIEIDEGRSDDATSLTSQSSLPLDNQSDSSPNNNGGSAHDTSDDSASFHDVIIPDTNNQTEAMATPIQFSKTFNQIDTENVPKNTNPGVAIPEISILEEGQGDTTVYYSDDMWSSDEFEQTDDEILEGAGDEMGDNSSGSLEITGIEGKEYIALADYSRVDPSELSLTEGDKVVTLRLGTDGWWYVQSTNKEEGWVPASYLAAFHRHSHSDISMSSEESGSNVSGALKNFDNNSTSIPLDEMEEIVV